MLLIRDIHFRLLINGRGGEKNPGEFRATQNWIGPSGCKIEAARFVPPPVPEMKEALYSLEKSLHDEQVKMPVLIRIGLAHAQFETIHPFLDGNGRMGRLLITFLLCERKVLRQPLLYLSYFFKLHRDEYYGRLQDVRDHGNWEDWLKFFLTGVEVVATQATETARKILILREEHRRLVKTANGVRLLKILYSRPILNANKVGKVLQVAFPTANNLIKQFCDLGILKETTGHIGTACSCTSRISASLKTP